MCACCAYISIYIYIYIYIRMAYMKGLLARNPIEYLILWYRLYSFEVCFVTKSCTIHLLWGDILFFYKNLMASVSKSPRFCLIFLADFGSFIALFWFLFFMVFLTPCWIQEIALLLTRLVTMSLRLLEDWSRWWTRLQLALRIANLKFLSGGERHV